jgi:hypothetical protein
MDDALAVSVGDRLRQRQDGGQEAEPLARAPALGDRVLQRARSVDQLHGIKGRAVPEQASLVQRHDGRVLEPRGDADFPREPPEHRRRAQERQLQRYGAIEPPIAGANDATQAAPGDLTFQLVGPSVDAASSPVTWPR